jgi:hypothetical protein
MLSKSRWRRGRNRLCWSVDPTFGRRNSRSAWPTLESVSPWETFSAHWSDDVLRRGQHRVARPDLLRRQHLVAGGDRPTATRKAKLSTTKFSKPNIVSRRKQSHANRVMASQVLTTLRPIGVVVKSACCCFLRVCGSVERSAGSLPMWIGSVAELFGWKWSAACGRRAPFFLRAQVTRIICGCKTAQPRRSARTWSSLSHLA